MPDDNSVRTSAITSDERIRNVLHRHIRRAYDRHDFTRDQLARESKVHISQIDQIMSGDKAKHRRVACEDAFCLAYTLGDDAVAALVGCIHYNATKNEPEAVDARRLVASILPQVSVLAEAAADGRIDHTEVPACRDAADHIIAIVTPLSSAGDA
jgi:hypothetical protein